MISVAKIHPKLTPAKTSFVLHAPQAIHACLSLHMLNQGCIIFDKLDGEENVIRKVLLLGYRSGFQVSDVEEENNVRNLISRRDSPVTFMQMLLKETSLHTVVPFWQFVILLRVYSCSGWFLQCCHSSSSSGILPYFSIIMSNQSLIVISYSLRSKSYVHIFSKKLFFAGNL